MTVPYDGYNGDIENPAFFLHGEKVGSTYREYQRAKEALAAKAHEREFLHNLSDVARPVPMHTGISRGQYVRVVLNSEKSTGTDGAIHVALTEEGEIVLAVEAAPGMSITRRRTIRRPRWRFYDFWRYDSEKRDNSLRPESEWPVIEEIKR